MPYIIDSTSLKNNSIQALKNYISDNYSQINNKLKEHGAVLFRGFEINQPIDFEEIAFGLDSNLQNEYLGTSPRNPKTTYVFSASELPSHYPVMQHCEMSFLPNPPKKLMFFCEQEADFGGETPLCDFRKISKEMDPSIRKEFEEKGIKLIRNYSSPYKKKNSKFQLKSWTDIFKTTDKNIVEQKCKENNTRAKWTKNDHLILINQNNAFRVDSENNQKIWFNHLLSFHPYSSVIEYKKIAQKQKDFRSFKYYALLKIMVGYNNLIQNPTKRPLHAQFGDGTEIPKKYIEHIQDLVWKNLFFLDWQKGDIILIDNYTTSHGRMPFKGNRKIHIAWS
jgi:alpha-ketoglutarate-dependent taurine dioxygenase